MQIQGRLWKHSKRGRHASPLSGLCDRFVQDSRIEDTVAQAARLCRFSKCLRFSNPKTDGPPVLRLNRYERQEYDKPNSSQR